MAFSRRTRNERTIDPAAARAPTPATAVPDAGAPRCRAPPAKRSRRPAVLGIGALLVLRRRAGARRLAALHACTPRSSRRQSSAATSFRRCASRRCARATPIRSALLAGHDRGLRSGQHLMPAPAATSPSATSISATTSRRAICWPRSPRPSSITRSRKPRRRWRSIRPTLQQAQANRDLAQVTWDRDSTLVQQGWATQQQGDTDRLTCRRRRPRSRSRGQHHRAGGAAARCCSQQKAYQQRGRAVRRRRHPAQHRCRQPGAGRRHQRHASCSP